MKLAQLKLCFIAIVLTVLSWLKTPETKNMAKKRAQKSLKKFGTKFQSTNRLTKDSMVLRKQGNQFKIMPLFYCYKLITTVIQGKLEIASNAPPIFEESSPEFDEGRYNAKASTVSKKSPLSNSQSSPVLGKQV